MKGLYLLSKFKDENLLLLTVSDCRRLKEKEG
jgi:hypothetical protein